MQDEHKPNVEQLLPTLSRRLPALVWATSPSSTAVALPPLPCPRATGGLELDGRTHDYTADEWLPVVYDVAAPLRESARLDRDPLCSFSTPRRPFAGWRALSSARPGIARDPGSARRRPWPPAHRVHVRERGGDRGGRGDDSGRLRISAAGCIPSDERPSRGANSGTPSIRFAGPARVVTRYRRAALSCRCARRPIRSQLPMRRSTTGFV